MGLCGVVNFKDWQYLKWESNLPPELPITVMPWSASSGPFLDGTYKTSNELPKGDVIGVEYFITYANTNLYTSTGNSYIAWAEDYVWSSSFVEVGNLFVSSTGHYAIDKDTRQKVWSYETVDNEPPSTHAYYDNSQIVINDTYCMFNSDWESAFVILKTQTGQVIYKGNFTDLGANLEWLYYTNWFQLRAKNEFLMITDNPDAYPYKLTYIVSINEQDVVSLALHPHSSALLPSEGIDVELFGSMYNYSPEVMYLLDRETGDYYLFNEINGAVSRFNVNHQLMWTFMMPDYIYDEESGGYYDRVTGFHNFDYSRMSIIGDKLFLISGNDAFVNLSLPVVSLDIATGTDFNYPKFSFSTYASGEYLQPGWEYLRTNFYRAFGDIHAPKMVDKNAREALILFYTRPTSSTFTLTIGAINKDTLDIRIVESDVNRHFENSDLRLRDFAGGYFGSLQQDGRGDYFSIVKDYNVKISGMRLIKFNSRGIKQASILDTGRLMETVSMWPSHFEDGQLYFTGNYGGYVVRTTTAENAYRIPVGRSVPLVRDAWYDEYSNVWNPGFIGKGHAYESYYLVHTTEFSGRLIPLTSRRFLDTETGLEVTPFGPTEWNLAFYGVFPYDSQHYIVRRYGSLSSQTKPQLMDLDTLELKDMPELAWPPPNSTNLRCEKLLRRANGNLVAIFLKPSTTQHTRAFEWNGVSWTELFYINSVFMNSGGLYNDKYYGLTVFSNLTLSVYEYDFATGILSLYDTPVADAPTALYSKQQLPLNPNLTVCSTISNDGVVYFDNSYEYSIPNKTLIEVPVAYDPRDTLAQLGDAGAVTSSMRGNVFVHNGVLYRGDAIFKARPIRDNVISSY